MLLSAALQIVIFPLPGLYWLSWVAVTPLLIALLRTSAPDTLQIDAGVHRVPATPWQAFLLSYLCGVLWYVGTCYWIFDTMHRYGGIVFPAALAILILFSLYLGLYHGVFGLLIALVARRRASFRKALVLAPCFWVALELAKTRISAFPWNLMGYAQAQDTALTRIASLTGVYGLSFEILLVNCAFAAAFLMARERRKSLLIAAFAAAIVLQAGQLLSPSPLPADKRALLVQPNIPVKENWTPEYFQGTLRDLTWISLYRSGQRTTERFDLLVWPESPSPFFLNDQAFRAVVADVAGQSRSWMVVGSVGGDNTATTPQQKNDVFNSAGLISPAGQLVARYDKVHLVPFGEYVPFKNVVPFMDMLTQQVGDFVHGHSWAPLQAGGQRLGMSICYESIFPDEVRQAPRQGANVLVNISNDGWYGDSGAWKQHLRMTQMRAVENGRWLLLATNTGMTASVDPYGRIVAATGRQLRTALEAPYALLSGTTFYTRHGDWFGYLCAIISAGAIGAGLLKNKESVVRSQSSAEFKRARNSLPETWHL